MLPCTQVLSNQSRGSQLDSVTLAIVKGQTIAVESLFARYGETRRRVNAAAQETDRSSGRLMVQSFQYHRVGRTKRSAYFLFWLSRF
jgi:hypothetical protein